MRVRYGETKLYVDRKKTKADLNNNGKARGNRDMSDSTVKLSEVVIRNPQVMSFPDLLQAIGKRGADGATMLEIDLKPDFPDTPRDWETKVEQAFTWGGK